MSRLRVLFNAASLACLLPVAAAAPAQERTAAELLRSLPLDSIPGRVTTFHAPADSARARALHRLYGGLADFYRERFGVDLEARIAILDPGQWEAYAALREEHGQEMRLPYGFPHVLFYGAPAVVVLPASSREGAMADAVRQLGLGSETQVGRYVDVVGFHEFGHAVVQRYLYEAPVFRPARIRWFDELMATFAGQGYLWQEQGLDSDPVRLALLGDFEPPLRSFAEFETTAPWEMGLVNYGWYQAQFAERARAVFASQGPGFLERVRNELPWDRFEEWTTGELLEWLERIEPGFVAWGRELE